MRPVGIILMVVAVIAAALTAFLAKRWLDVQSARPAVEQVRTAEVLVVAQETPAGTVLQSDDLRYEAWPLSSVASRMLTRKPGEDLKAQFVGKVARRQLAAGEPFTAAATFGAESGGVMAGLLAPGRRALSIAVTGASGVSGFITPGDRVDIVLSSDIRKAEGGEAKADGPLVRFAAEIVLEDIKILAIDQQIARARDGSGIQGKTATVEVTPKQAELLIAAGMLGQLSLVLRGIPANAADPNAAPNADPKAALNAAEDPRSSDFTADIEASKALQALHGKAKGPQAAGGGGTQIQINRAGQVSTQSLAR